MFYVFSFPAAIYVGTLNVIASIPDPSIFSLVAETAAWPTPFSLICSLFLKDLNFIFIFIDLLTLYMSIK